MIHIVFPHLERLFAHVYQIHIEICKLNQRPTFPLRQLVNHRITLRRDVVYNLDTVTMSV